MPTAKPSTATATVITLDYRNTAHREAAADLVLNLFAESPAAVLGKHFLTEFYFLDLVRDQELECLLYSHHGKYVAFALYTENPFGFIKKGIRRHFAKLSWLTAISLASRPSRLATLFNVLQQGAWRHQNDPGKKIGELLTFGVLEAFRNEVVPQSGKKISAHLFFASLKNMRKQGCQIAQLVAYKDNVKAQAFFKKCGGVVDDVAYLSQRSNVIRFDLESL